MTTLQHALAFLLVFVGLGPGVVIGADFLRRNFAVSKACAVIAGAAIVSVAGYLLFWLWLASPAAGWSGWAAVNALGLWVGHRHRASVLALVRDVDVAGPLLLWLTVGLTYIGVLHLYQNTMQVDQLAADRFTAGLPGDNWIPRVLAECLIKDADPRGVFGGWATSDRPPLQSGVILLGYPLPHFAKIPVDVGGNAAGVWFQLLWIPGVWAVVRACGARVGVAALVVAAAAATGFFTLQTMYAWPKLSAGALLLGAFVIYRDGGGRSPRLAGLAAGMMALAWLSHGGAAFALLALALLVAMAGPRPGVAAGVCGVLVFGVLAAPWIAYQKFYDPPGDRLLKWHLAGKVDFEPGSLGDALKQRYREVGWSGAWENRITNVKKIFGAGWQSWFTLDQKHAEYRRNGEFFNFFRAFGIWNLALLFFPWIYFRKTSAAVATEGRALFGSLLAWTALTTVVWVVLMFGPDATVNHQGVYSTLMAGFLLYMVAAYHVSPWAFGVLAVLQAAHYAITWLVPSTKLTDAPFETAGMAVAICGALAVAAVVWRVMRTDREEEASAPPADRVPSRL